MGLCTDKYKTGRKARWLEHAWSPSLYWIAEFRVSGTGDSQGRIQRIAAGVQSDKTLSLKKGPCHSLEKKEM